MRLGCRYFSSARSRGSERLRDGEDRVHSAGTGLGASHEEEVLVQAKSRLSVWGSCRQSSKFPREPMAWGGGLRDGCRCCTQVDSGLQ